MMYLTENGHTGKRTRARTPMIRPIINPFLERVVSNLKVQNLELGSDGEEYSRICGYLRFLV